MHVHVHLKLTTMVQHYYHFMYGLVEAVVLTQNEDNNEQHVDVMRALVTTVMEETKQRKDLCVHVHCTLYMCAHKYMCVWGAYVCVCGEPVYVGSLCVWGAYVCGEPVCVGSLCMCVESLCMCVGSLCMWGAYVRGEPVCGGSLCMCVGSLCVWGACVRGEPVCGGSLCVCICTLHVYNTNTNSETCFHKQCTYLCEICFRDKGTTKCSSKHSVCSICTLCLTSWSISDLENMKLATFELP